MLFDNLFGMMTPAATAGLLAGLVGVFAAVTGGYVAYEGRRRRCRLATDSRV